VEDIKVCILCHVSFPKLRVNYRTREVKEIIVGGLNMIWRHVGAICVTNNEDKHTDVLSELRCKSTVLMHCFHSVNIRTVYRSARLEC